MKSNPCYQKLDNNLFNLFIMTKILKTQKGSSIKRSKYGVGKLIGGALYFHADYVNDVPFNFSDYIEALYQFNKDFRYNVIKWHKKKGNVTFFNSPEFNAVHEPSAGEYVTIKKNFTAKRAYTSQIWHHKWLWVKDDYKGFDVEESFKRSQQWLQLPDIEFAKIGNKAYWEKQCVPRIKEVRDGEPNAQRMRAGHFYFTQ